MNPQEGTEKLKTGCPVLKEQVKLPVITEFK